LKAAVEIPNTLSFDLQPLQTPQYRLKFSNSLTGKVSSKLWLGDNASFSATIPLWEATIKEGSWLLPHTLTYISGNDEQAAPNSYLKDDLKVLVKDINGNIYKSAKVSWSIKSGGGKFEAPETFTDAN